ncbi:MAG: M48 family metallopeptidase [Bacteroidota bacterium]
MEQKTFNISLIGPVTIRKNPRAKRIILKIYSSKDIRISIPSRTSYQQGIAFAENKKEWIRKTCKQLNHKQSEHLLFLHQPHYKSKYHQIEIQSHPGTFTKNQRNNKLILKYPGHLTIPSPEVQNFFKKEMMKIWKKEAHYYLPERVDFFARRHQLFYNRISIRNNKTRWGSCSYNNNLNLNLHLVRLPDELSDYVILHELAHTVHKNHSRQFWSYLSLLCPDYKERSKALKQYSLHNYFIN